MTVPGPKMAAAPASMRASWSWGGITPPQTTTTGQALSGSGGGSDGALLGGAVAGGLLGALLLVCGGRLLSNSLRARQSKASLLSQKHLLDSGKYREAITYRGQHSTTPVPSTVATSRLTSGHV